MWDQFRAIAARLGLSREQVEAVERGGVPTEIQDPRNPQVHIRVRPDPDWTERMTDAWHGELVNSRRQSAGTIPVPGGTLFVGDANAVDVPGTPRNGATARVVAGDYEIVLTIAHRGVEAEGSYEEHVSHVFALLRDNKGVAAIAPMTADDGSELWIDTGSMMFAGTGVVDRLAAEHPDVGRWQIVNLSAPSVPATIGPDGFWKRIATRDGSGALITVRGGYGRGDYPLFRIDDPDGNTVGVLVDFFVDNRPH